MISLRRKAAKISPSVTTTNSHGWLLDTDGAAMAARSSSKSFSCSTAWGVYFRMLRQAKMSSITSIGVTFSPVAGTGQTNRTRHPASGA